MFSIWQKNENKNIGFEDVKIGIQNNYILINVLPISMQNILIQTTVSVEKEEQIINSMINDYLVPDTPVIVYGLHNCDNKIEQKYKQLKNLGINDIYIYCGGLFEWLLLNELYGCEEFPIYNENSERIDLLKYRPLSVLQKNQNML